MGSIIFVVSWMLAGFVSGIIASSWYRYEIHGCKKVIVFDIFIGILSTSLGYIFFIIIVIGIVSIQLESLFEYTIWEED